MSLTRNENENNFVDKFEKRSSSTRRRPEAKFSDGGSVMAMERIRKLLDGGGTGQSFNDPDANLFDNDHEDHRSSFADETEWTVDELTSPELRQLQNYVNNKGNDLVEKKNAQNSNTALAAVQKLRAEERTEKLKEIEGYDKDGSLLSLYRIWSLIPPAYNFDRQRLAEMLARRVLYNKDDLIAINKPYGISTTRSVTEGGRMAVATALGHLRPLIAPKAEKLYFLHRLDKCTTGILLLASSKLRASELQDMLKQKKVHKRYWTLVRNVPDPEEGIIDIPLIETKLNGRFKTIPVMRPGQTAELRFGKIPLERIENKGSMDKDSPVTEYRVIKTGPQCSLLECTIRSGFTHQIRCHLGFGLNTPVLGDHKYSDYMEYLPQRLPPSMLQLLGIRSAKSRSMPMHLHAREILIPEYSQGRNLHIKCLLPKYFVYVLRKLKIPLK